MQQKMTRMEPGLDPAFMHWAALTDAYAAQLAAMARGEPEARAEAVRLAEQLCGMQEPEPLPPHGI